MIDAHIAELVAQGTIDAGLLKIGNRFAHAHLGVFEIAENMRSIGDKDLSDLGLQFAAFVDVDGDVYKRQPSTWRGRPTAVRTAATISRRSPCRSRICGESSVDAHEFFGEKIKQESIILTQL